MYSLRKQYKKQRDEFDKLSDDYKIYDRRQFTMKVLMNSTYGLFGMSSYRYSNKWLAKSITTQGRLALKTAQFFADLYLKNKYGTDKQQN
jgi:DNA polymerase elongation subunit (family B)